MVPVAPTRSAEELTEHVRASFSTGGSEGRITVEAVDATAIRVRMRPEASDLRPGDTVAGPTLFVLADTVAWLLTLAQLPPGTEAVTSDVAMQFLRRPPLADLVGTGTLLRMGRRSSVVDVALRSDGLVEPVAHATVTYAPLLPR